MRFFIITQGLWGLSGRGVEVSYLFGVTNGVRISISTCEDASGVSCSPLLRSTCMLFLVELFAMLGRSTNRS